MAGYDTYFLMKEEELGKEEKVVKSFLANLLKVNQKMLLRGYQNILIKKLRRNYNGF